MKIEFKCFLVLLLGLFSAFLYFFLHELGHITATILFGESIEHISLFPLPSVRAVIGAKPAFQIISGFAGVIFPFTLALLINPQSFWLWYVKFITMAICAYSFAVEAGAVIGFILGTPLPHDDATELLTAGIINPFSALGLFLLLLIISVLALILEHPVKRIKNGLFTL